MANCPKCNYKLRVWHIKAECPNCHVNIPNYDWENRLEQDSAEAEAAFGKMRHTMVYFKYAIIGTPLRIARLPISFLPFFSFLLPLINIQFSMPYFEGNKNRNIITIITELVKADLSSLMTFCGSPAMGAVAKGLWAAFILLLLAFLSLPLVSLVFLLLNYRNLHSKGLFFSNLIAGIFLTASGILFNYSGSLLQAGKVDAFTPGAAWGLWFCVGAFFLSSAINLAVSKSSVDTQALEEKAKEAQEKRSF
ncbi:MAG: hypothetical protein ACOYJX_00255 [Acutalibacteraceae bacterium]|jgi:hypothetical protein